MSKGYRFWVVIALVAGIVLAAATKPDLKSVPPLVALVSGLLVVLIPGLGDPVSRFLDRVRRPYSKLRWTIAIVLVLLSARYFLLSADLADRPLLPQFHDEFMYLLQARMLAHGHLWMPPHPLAEFFDSFLIIVRPVYAAIYFPGAALAYVPGMWLGIPPSVTSVAIASLGVGMMYLLMTELTDGVWGLVAALLAVSLEQWRTLSVAVISHPVVILQTLVVAWCLLHWTRSLRIGWIIVAGAFAGWAAITRPLDALVLILPIGVAAVWVQFRAGPHSRRLLVHLGVAILAACPFLALQLIQDRGLTGRWLQTPVAAYDEQNFPGMDIGGNGASTFAESPSPLPQVRDYYRSFLRPAFAAYREHGLLWTWVADRLPKTARTCLCTPWLLLLVPLGVLSLKTPWQIAVALGVITASLAYALVPIYLAHYGLIASPAFILLVLLGCRSISTAFAGVPRLSGALAIGLAVLAIASLPELRGTRDHFIRPVFLSDIVLKLQDLEHKPAVVLFTYHRGNDVHEEPVYNLDAPWPDDCQVIRAQDRGPDDRRIFEYYAQRQPNRFFYRYDRGTAQLMPLGWAKDLAVAR